LNAIQNIDAQIQKYNKEKEKCKIDLPKLYSEMVDS
jgi:hypothetical protein